jgi:hypothetical protein
MKGRLAKMAAVGAIVGAIVSPIAVGAEVSSEPLVPIAKPERMQLRHFAIFHTPPEPIPSKWRSSLEQGQRAASEGSSHSESDVLIATSNYSLAQRVDIRGQSQSVHPVWVVPASGYITLMNFQSGHASGLPMTTRRAVRRGITRKQFGLVPDGVIAVRLSDTITAPVHENFFSVRADPSTLWAHPRFIHGAWATHSGR